MANLLIVVRRTYCIEYIYMTLMGLFSSLVTDLAHVDARSQHLIKSYITFEEGNGGFFR